MPFPVFLYQTDADQVLFIFTSGNCQHVPPSKTIPLPDAFLAIVPSAKVASRLFDVKSCHAPLPEYLEAFKYTNAPSGVKFSELPYVGANIKSPWLSQAADTVKPSPEIPK